MRSQAKLCHVDSCNWLNGKGCTKLDLIEGLTSKTPIVGPASPVPTRAHGRAYTWQIVVGCEAPRERAVGDFDYNIEIR